MERPFLGFWRNAERFLQFNDSAKPYFCQGCTENFSFSAFVLPCSPGAGAPGHPPPAGGPPPGGAAPPPPHPTPAPMRRAPEGLAPLDSRYRLRAGREKRAARARRASVPAAAVLKVLLDFFQKIAGVPRAEPSAGCRGSAPAGRAVSAQAGLELRADGRDFCLPFARCSNADRVSRRARDHRKHQPQQVADRQMSASECRRPAKCRGK